MNLLQNLVAQYEVNWWCTGIIPIGQKKLSKKQAAFQAELGGYVKNFIDAEYLNKSWVVAVSYTHLDVYKRQGQRSI